MRQNALDTANLNYGKQLTLSPEELTDSQSYAFRYKQKNEPTKQEYVLVESPLATGSVSTRCMPQLNECESTWHKIRR